MFVPITLGCTLPRPIDALINTLSLSDITLSPPASLLAVQKNSSTVNSNEETVTITGSNFSSATIIRINGNSVVTTFIDSSKVSIIIPKDSLRKPGYLYFSVVNANSGAPEYLDSLNPNIKVVKIKTPVPVLGALSVQTTSANAPTRPWTITVTGQNFFAGARAVYNGDTLDASKVQFVSATQLRVILPALAQQAGTYSLRILNPSPTDSTSNALSFTAHFVPTSVLSFTPQTATIGQIITIRGTSFRSATAVSVGGTSVLNYTVVSDSVITATLGNGATGSVSVTTPNGVGTLDGFTFQALTPPIISSFAPTSARPGDTVVVTGVNFLNASTVSFGGVGMQFSVLSDSVIHAYITASALSGAVRVVTPNGVGNMNGFKFIALPAAPRIMSFTPNRAAEGSSVVITGANFTTATTRVRFGAFDAASFVVDSPTQITAVVGVGSSGAVSVQTAGGTATLNGFTFVPPSATISGFTPTSAAVGQSVVITGTNLASALTVEFGGRSAVFTVNSDTQITATVPAGAASGNVSVTTLAGTASLAGFTFLAPPSLTSFTPTSAPIGASVVLAGSNFTSVDTVRIGGVVAAFTVNSESQITATVPTGAASGSVSVRSPYGTSTLAGFTLLPSPVITSFTPAVAGANDVVTINGSNFTGTTVVSFGGTAAASFTVVSATRITATLSAAGSSGEISVTTPNGTGTRAGFSFAGVPAITAFSPTGGTGGDTITVKGTNFVGVSAFSFGNTAASSFTVVSPTEIKAVVSPRGATGAVKLTTPGGTASLNGFTFTAPAPVITGFSPASATVEQTVTITGRNFSGDSFSTLSVSFGGRAAGRFTVVNDSTIQAVVGGGATGSVSVRTPGGTANRAGFTFIPAPPVITSFTPTSAPVGATITISGNNFFGASNVKFGGITATNLVVVNDSTVTARVAAGTVSGSVTLTTPSGTGTLAGFTFIPSPVITSFAPTTASVGDTVTLTGTGFTGATAVRFGGTAATRFTVVSDTEIMAVVAAGATGAVTVVSPNGTGTLAGFTFAPPAPRITSFSPTTAAAGTSVIINGANFTGTTAVSFGGVAATSFVVNSATRITAVVAANSASGDVSVTSPNGTGTRAGFTFLAAPPTITNFSPTTTPVGGTVLIRGTGFTAASAVRFGGTAAASFTRTGDTLISARVASGGASGDVSVVTPAGTGVLSGFVFIPAPVVTSFAPTSASQGDTVTITGTNLSGATNVRFGNVVASIVSITPTEVRAIVGSGASGSASLTTPGGTATLAGFTFLPPGPRITGFTPATATPGTSVVISGANFTGTTAVSFGGVAAASFVVNSSTRITAVVPTGGASGAISVTTPNGTGSMAGFTFTLVPAPVITSFTPTTMPSGSTMTVMTINGSNFTGATAVSVGGVAVPFTVVSATRITANLTGALSGAVSVTTPGGTATMAGFVVAGGNLFDGISSAPKANNATLNGQATTTVRTFGNESLTASYAPTIYPNPMRDAFTLVSSGFADGQAVEITLVDVLGQVLMRSTAKSSAGMLRTELNVANIPSGTYMVILNTAQVRRVARLTKID